MSFRHHLGWIMLIAATFSLTGATNAMAQADKAGCQDHPLFPTRMPDYVIETCKVEDFGIYQFFAV